jgi:hypothetical protein
VDDGEKWNREPCAILIPEAQLRWRQNMLEMALEHSESRNAQKAASRRHGNWKLNIFTRKPRSVISIGKRRCGI